MESSEDDAGIATNASRRESAREMESNQSEMSSAIADGSEEASELQQPIRTLATPESNFDGDSVSSPSTQDVNTSTEAILDLIDEFVDGPGAPKRLSGSFDTECQSNSTYTEADNNKLVSNSQPTHNISENIPLPSTSAKTEESAEHLPLLATLHDTSQPVSSEVPNIGPVDCPQKSSLVPPSNDPVSININLCDEVSAYVSGVQSNESSLPNIPSSSVLEPRIDISSLSESNPCERTISKCVTSSDNIDNVKVESAESTSSDLNASVDSASVNQSPQRRRLVRPTNVDRRPDTTVSSTVDSFSENLHTTEGLSSDTLKDVSSSSDAVTSNLSDGRSNEQTSSASNVSVCKAETSVSSPKRIKLIRNKVLPQSHSNVSQISSESHQCESTSSEPVQPCLIETGPSTSSSVNCISTSENSNSDSSNTSKFCLINQNIETESNVSENKSEILENVPHCKLLNEIPLESSKVDSVDKELDQRRVAPLKLSLHATTSIESKAEIEKCIELTSSTKLNEHHQEASETVKQIPKLTIKLNSKPSDEQKSPVPKVTIKPLKPPTECEGSEKVSINEAPINIPSVTKINIKPIKPPEKINVLHRKSSSSEISESECSENDDTTSASGNTSASDHGSSDIVPKVTIKLGKPGTETEGKFYTEQNVPKLTLKNIQNEEEENFSKIRLKLCQADEKQFEIVPKLTIKTVTKVENQPLSPKLTIKPIKPPDIASTEISSEDRNFHQISKMKLIQDAVSSSEMKDSGHIPKITIKPFSKSEDSIGKPSKKCSSKTDVVEHIPVVTKLNIKPVVKPDASIADGNNSDDREENVPVVAKLNIKPVLKPKEDKLESSPDNTPKVTKLNIKPIKSPEIELSEDKELSEGSEQESDKSIPVITKLNIKPIVKHSEEETSKDSNSPETGNSSDDNIDIPVVTKLNIKPIVKPLNLAGEASALNVDNIPVITKLNIKPICKPDQSAPISPKRDSVKSADLVSSDTPVVTKLNIKPIVKPSDQDNLSTHHEENDNSIKLPPIVMKINIKDISDAVHSDNYSVKETLSNHLHEDERSKYNNANENIPIVTKLNIKPIQKPLTECDTKELLSKDKQLVDQPVTNEDKHQTQTSNTHFTDYQCNTNVLKLNCVIDIKESKSKRNSSINSDIKHDVEQSHNLSSTSSTTSLSNCKDQFKSEKEIQYNKHGANDNSMELMEHNINTDKETEDDSCKVLKKLLKENTRSEEKLSNKATDTLLNNLNSPYSVRNRTSDLSNFIGEKINCFKEDVVKKEPDKTFRQIATHTNAKTSEEVKLEKEDKPAEDGVPKYFFSNSETILKPLEITMSEKSSIVESSGQDSPRIILKINKTDHGASAHIITDEVNKPEMQLSPTVSKPTDSSINTQSGSVVDKARGRRSMLSSKKVLENVESSAVPMGKRLRSSKVVQESDLTAKRNTGKRASVLESNTTPSKESEISLLESKRLKLGQLLSNKALTITPVVRLSHQPPINKHSSVDIKNVSPKSLNHGLMNNENCSKNGNSKLHNILSNLHAKHDKQVIPGYSETNCNMPNTKLLLDIDSNASITPDVEEVVSIDNSHPSVQEMLINESSESREFNIVSEELSQDPLEINSKGLIDSNNLVNSSPPPEILLTPQPKKRGRPRKTPVIPTISPPAIEESKPSTPVLPVPALEERPQRSLRLTRDRPAILSKPRRGRGRGFKRMLTTTVETTPERDEAVDVANKFFTSQKREDIDPTSARIKLPRLTEVLANLPSTPLSSLRESSTSTADLKLFAESTQLQAGLDNLTPLRSRGGRGRYRGRGSRTPARSPRGRGRGRGGGRGAVYMKETMGIYGRVCGPATTTVQLFEEETCMMDDNATPAKPSHLLDEDSQSSVKSSTNESSKTRKSKFADLFDSSKVWTASDVKEYLWPPPEQMDTNHQVMMIQEQVAMFLSVKSFKRRYPELKRRPIASDERDYVLSQGLVTEALCDLGMTAVDAGEVLDIMLSDFPHKYEEYRSYQRERQLTVPIVSEPEPQKSEVKNDVKLDPKATDHKPEPPPEKTRQDQAAAAIASASEWNTRLNALRRAACVDLQSMTIQRPRPSVSVAPSFHCEPPSGFYPHALLPGQYQHHYRVYTPEQLRCLPISTVLSAPPVPTPAPCNDSSSESDAEWGSGLSSSESDTERTPAAKRKKLLLKSKSSTIEPPKDEVDGDVELCRTCGLREEANRKYSFERFLACSHCNAKLHPACLELGPNTIRKCRDYPWQCAECKSCCSCGRRRDDDKMLFCDLCDRGFHIYCVGLPKVPSGRWHCVECAVCKSCGARTPGGGGGDAEGEWHHQSKRGPGGHKLYSHSLCTPCARMR